MKETFSSFLISLYIQFDYKNYSWVSVKYIIPPLPVQHTPNLPPPYTLLPCKALFDSREEFKTFSEKQELETFVIIKPTYIKQLINCKINNPP